MCPGLIAEYLVKQRSSPESAVFESAGIGLVSNESVSAAIETLQSFFSIDATKHAPRDIDQVDQFRFTLILTIDDPAANKVYTLLKQPGARHQ